MKNRLKAMLLSGAVLAAVFGSMVSTASAQAALGGSLPITPPPPPLPQEMRTYDYHTIRLLMDVRKYLFDSFIRLSRLEGYAFENFEESRDINNSTKETLKEIKFNTNLRLQTVQTDIKRVFDVNQKAEINIGKILNELIKFFNKPGGMGAALIGKNKPIPYFDNQIDKAAREPVPNFDTLADDMRTKNTPPVTAYTPAMSQAITRYKLEDTIKFQPTLDPKNSLYVTRERRSHVASSAVTAFAVSEGAFKQASKSMERINTYIQAIKDSEDIKTSVDLNTRVMLEIVQQNNELLRSIAAMNSVNANYMMFNLGGK